MIKLVKASNLYVGYTAYKTNAEATINENKKNILAENVDGLTMLRDSKREIFLKKGGLYYNIVDVDKSYSLSKKLSSKYAYPVLSSEHLDKILPGEEVIIKESLKKINLLEEACKLGINDTEISNYFSNNLNSARLSLSYVKRLNQVIR